MYFMPQCGIIRSGIFNYLDLDLDNYDFHTVNVTSQNNNFLLYTLFTSAFKLSNWSSCFHFIFCSAICF